MFESIKGETRWEDAKSRRRLFRSPLRDAFGATLVAALTLGLARFYGANEVTLASILISLCAGLASAFLLPMAEAAFLWFRIPRLRLEEELEAARQDRSATLTPAGKAPVNGRRATTHSKTISDDLLRPTQAKIIALPLRVCLIAEVNGHWIETTEASGDSIQAVVAGIRNAGGNTLDMVRARLSFHNQSGYSISAASVNYACWLRESFNFVTLEPGDTRDAVLFVKGPNKYLALEDLRHSIDKNDGFAPLRVIDDIPTSGFLTLLITMELWESGVDFTPTEFAYRVIDDPRHGIVTESL